MATELDKLLSRRWFVSSAKALMWREWGMLWAKRVHMANLLHVTHHLVMMDSPKSWWDACAQTHTHEAQTHTHTDTHTHIHTYAPTMCSHVITHKDIFISWSHTHTHTHTHTNTNSCYTHTHIFNTNKTGNQIFHFAFVGVQSYMFVMRAKRQSSDQYCGILCEIRFFCEITHFLTIMLLLIISIIKKKELSDNQLFWPYYKLPPLFLDYLGHTMTLPCELWPTYGGLIHSHALVISKGMDDDVQRC